MTLLQLISQILLKMIFFLLMCTFLFLFTSSGTHFAKLLGLFGALGMGRVWDGQSKEQAVWLTGGGGGFGCKTFCLLWLVELLKARHALCHQVCLSPCQCMYGCDGTWPMLFLFSKPGELYKVGNSWPLGVYTMLLPFCVALTVNTSEKCFWEEQVMEVTAYTSETAGPDW